MQQAELKAHEQLRCSANVLPRGPGALKCTMLLALTGARQPSVVGLAPAK